jgi:hypothetical protein
MTFQLQVDKNSFQFHIIFIGTNPVTDGAYNRTSAAAKAPVVLYFCAACASIFSITMALEPPRL